MQTRHTNTDDDSHTATRSTFHIYCTDSNLSVCGPATQILTMTATLQPALTSIFTVQTATCPYPAPPHNHTATRSTFHIYCTDSNLSLCRPATQPDCNPLYLPYLLYRQQLVLMQTRHTATLQPTLYSIFTVQTATCPYADPPHSHTAT